MSTTAVELQQKVEQEIVDRGLQRYVERTTAKVKREGFDKHDEVQKLVKGAVPILAEGIVEWLAQAKLAKGRKPTGYKAIASLDPHVVAAIGVTAIFKQLGEGGWVSKIVTTIGRRIEAELEGAALEAKSPKAAMRFLKLAEGSVSEDVLAERLRALVDEHEAALKWAEDTRALVGQSVLNVALVKLDGVFSARTGDRLKGKTPAIVELTDEAAAVLVEMEDAAAMGHLPFRPMVSPPRKWEGLTSGAYYDWRIAKLVPMVRTKTGEQRRLIKEAIADGSMQEVLDALNAIQDTRWAIDTRVLRWVRWTKEEGLRTAASFPATTLPDLPPAVEKEVWESMPQEERSARSRKRKSIKTVRKTMGVEGKTFQEDLGEADHLAGVEAFWLPHSLDFRGRTYAVPYFNHQRSDHLKALFRFADGVPLGPDGGEQLMIHLANCGDFDKVSKKPMAARVAWVEENATQIIAAAHNPDVWYEWWAQADSPFCFLQACFEYAAWASSGFSPDFVSTIAGAADGSCSGLQHYSCITRSKEEAFHVNLLPREDVGDIYRVVSAEAEPTLRLTASMVSEEDPKVRLDAEAAGIILANGFGRSEVKRNVMTYFYGSARFGMRDQHMQDIMRPLADKVAMGELGTHPYQMLTERTDKDTGEVRMVLDGGYTCAAVMAAHVYSAVTTVAAKAEEASTWIQTTASILAHEGRSMVWRTQTGFPVVQRYSEFTSKQVTFWLYDRKLTVPAGTDKVDPDGNVLARVQVLIRQSPTARVDKKSMRNASSPNVIHSMDAAHLHRSVAMAKAAGIDHFAMIHDSFGTHLGNMAKFNRIIRDALVSCYADYCPLQEIDSYARSVLGDESIEKLPPLPTRGDLDLSAIRESVYAFA